MNITQEMYVEPTFKTEHLGGYIWPLVLLRFYGLVDFNDSESTAVALVFCELFSSMMAWISICSSLPFFLWSDL